MFGESESSARIPFTLINILFIVGFYIITRKFLSEWIALPAAIVLAFSPFAIEMSRECRMYTLFQLLYFIAGIAFFKGFECSKISFLGHRVHFFHRIEKKWQINFCYLILSLLFGLFAITVHTLTFTFVFVIIAYCLVMLFYDYFIAKNRLFFRSKYLIMLIILSCLSLIIYLTLSTFANNMINLVNHVPYWLKNRQHDYNYYRYFLSDGYPALFYLWPISAFWIIKKYGKAGLFFTISFISAFIAHNFFFLQKVPRYIFYVFPYFVIVGVAFIEPILQHVAKNLNKIFQITHPASKYMIIVLSIPALNFFGYPWLTNSFDVAGTNKFPDWKNLPAQTRKIIIQKEIITTNPRQVIYYLNKKPKYILLNFEERKKFKNYNLIENNEELKKILNEENELIFIGDRFNNREYVDSEMRKLILNKMLTINSNKKSRVVAFIK